ncbi:RagB/SusD family nutrient uptake outer membrane protein [Pontibacter toksunensis]|uniref:RagB/SusD family nutrient uptake outer membrane protein n=1 Tax=Pontibacter toksunensis TaxID=1332631 RepID=A0ABW6BTQ2_9BACT
MNKKHILSVLGLSLALGTFSCEDKLNELRPEQEVQAGDVYASEANVYAVLNGVYSTMQNFEVFGGLSQVIGDFQADNVNFVGSFPTLQEIKSFSTVGTNATVRDLWQVHYRAITRANSLIANTPTVEDPSFTEEERAQVIAEAKFIRALLYFQLSNFFSQPWQVEQGTNLSVPLVLEPFVEEVTFPERATLNEVHAQIEEDLKEAIPNLNTFAEFGEDREGRGRATVAAAQALLSRLYLYRENWAQAEEYARLVLDGPAYDLATDYSFYTSGITEENIFSILNSAIDNGRTGSGGLASYYSPAAQGGRGDAPYSEDLITAFERTAVDGAIVDKRYTALTETGVAADDVTYPFTNKYPDAVNNSDNAPVIRVTEVVLTLAEAIARQATSVAEAQEAIDLINELRTRAGLPLYTVASFSSVEELIAAILYERRLELAFEGFRRMDLLRNRMPLITTGQGAARAVFGGDYTILPIPQRELDINPSLVPNPGY